MPEQFLDTIDLNAIAARVGTPFYVYSADVLRRRIADLCAIAPGGAVQARYAMKACSLRRLLEIVRDGGTYVVAGHYTDGGDATLNPHRHFNRKHVNLRGQWGTDFRHVVRALAVLARHADRLPFAKVIGARYGLAETDRALDDVAAMRVTKAVIDPKL